jgi:predicted ester cyclase
MPSTDHVQLIERIAESFNTGNLDAIDELLSPALTAFKRDLATARAAFPDARFTIEDVFGEGDKLVDRYTISGTHEHPWLGIPATGRKIRMAGITIVRIAGGKVVERWGVTDQIGLLQQLCALPQSLSETFRR